MYIHQIQEYHGVHFSYLIESTKKLRALGQSLRRQTHNSIAASIRMMTSSDLNLLERVVPLY